MNRNEIAKRAKEILVEGLRLEIEPGDIVDSDAIFGEGSGFATASPDIAPSLHEGEMPGLLPRGHPWTLEPDGGQRLTMCFQTENGCQ